MRLAILMMHLCGTCLAGASAAPPRRPNILFLMADEMDGRILDPASPQVKPPMPNLNRLAAAGIRFTTTYSQSPQCVPSRSAMMVGLRTDQIGVYDNFVGGIAVNGSSSDPDQYCVRSFGKAACIKMSKQRDRAPPTFIDRLADDGYGISLYGKMHAGWGLDRYPGSIQEFPFNNKGDTKELREWTRGAGPDINTRGCHQGTKANRPPDNEAAPALKVDYQCMDSCVQQLRNGLFSNAKQPQFLYCSIIVPHPPYASNSTYMKAVANLSLAVPEWVPKDQAHPNDRTTSTLKHMWNTDTYKAEDIIYARRVYFSMCYESDTLFGEILDALDDSGERDNTFVMMISDHGEDNYEHRQLGKNNMYDSASRVAMLVSGPGIKGGQEVSALTSLNDVYPTVLDMAGIPASEFPTDLAGSSVLALAAGDHNIVRRGVAERKDYVVAQYHSVFSVTGTFMLRQGVLKLVEYGPNAPYGGKNFPQQLFNLSADPWELNDIAASSPHDVTRLSALLATELNVTAVDAECKAIQRQLFLGSPAWKGSSQCQSVMENLFGQGSLNATDAPRISKWLGQPCPWSGPSPSDPTCAHGVKDAKGEVCCAKSCEVCAHPASACDARPGGKKACCPSIIQKAGNSCAKIGAPCVIDGPESERFV